MSWLQRACRLPSRGRGVHLVTDAVQATLQELGAGTLRIGLVNLLLQHTSASLCLGENADPQVRIDLESWLERLVPDGASYFRHTAEGPDDMPAHAKNAMLGASLTLPLVDGRLALGTWQGLYLCEHRIEPQQRDLLITCWGDPPDPTRRGWGRGPVTA